MGISKPWDHPVFLDWEESFSEIIRTEMVGDLTAEERAVHNC